MSSKGLRGVLESVDCIIVGWGGTSTLTLGIGSRAVISFVEDRDVYLTSFVASLLVLASSMRISGAEAPRGLWIEVQGL